MHWPVQFGHNKCHTDTVWCATADATQGALHIVPYHAAMVSLGYQHLPYYRTTPFKGECYWKWGN
jgi:hypothetical protein